MCSKIKIKGCSVFNKMVAYTLFGNNAKKMLPLENKQHKHLTCLKFQSVFQQFNFLAKYD